MFLCVCVRAPSLDEGGQEEGKAGHEEERKNMMLPAQGRTPSPTAAAPGGSVARKKVGLLPISSCCHCRHTRGSRFCATSPGVYPVLPSQFTRGGPPRAKASTRAKYKFNILFCVVGQNKVEPVPEHDFMYIEHGVYSSST